VLDVVGTISTVLDPLRAPITHRGTHYRGPGHALKFLSWGTSILGVDAELGRTCPTSSKDGLSACWVDEGDRSPLAGVDMLRRSRETSDRAEVVEVVEVVAGEDVWVEPPSSFDGRIV
jgi:hypothetical protein